MDEEIYRQLSSFVRTKTNELLKNHTSLRLGGPAAIWVEPETEEQLKRVVKILSFRPYFIIGAGSNILCSDSGYPGVVIHLKGDFSRTEFEQQKVVAGAGVFLPALINQAMSQNLGGLEILAGIPGTLGGALLMNAGTKWGEIANLVNRVKVMDRSGEIYWLDKKDISFSYRFSSLGGYFILAAELNLQPAAKEVIAEKMRQYLLERANNQPLSSYNAGSVFKNPPADFAARLIESCGLKGKSIGGAMVSDKHANFIINRGNASAEDVRNLIFLVQRIVQEKTGVLLEIEIKLIGFDEEKN